MDMISNEIGNARDHYGSKSRVGIESRCGGGDAGGRGKGSLAERRAAKFGFNADRINTALFRTDGPVDSPSARSPCLMIPPGISPTALLDSPILLPNSQPSPTTGTFRVPLSDHESLMPNTSNPVDNGSSADLFKCKRQRAPNTVPDISTQQHQGLSIPGLSQRIGVDSQVPMKVELPTDYEFPAKISKKNLEKICTIDSINNVKVSNNIIANQPVIKEDVGTSLPPGMVRNSEDGYNWRKYGQKQVKGSEYPRSYYKCTHANCLVKKKVERSYDGQITEIIYKGAHNHPKPQPSRRPLTFPSDEMYEKMEGNGSCVKVEGVPLWRNMHSGLRDFAFGSDLERTPCNSIVTELSDPLSPTQGKSYGAFESSETPELSSTRASHGDNDEDDGATQGSMLLADDADNDESQSKRRKTENSLYDSNLTARAVREPRVVIQIESDVDILDDGYRWRKYGQKVVKGNPNPRSYYKCTSPGCPVRKHVERASHDLKCVITTYEGKHNHEVPAARNSSHVNSSGGANLLPPLAGNAHSSLTLPKHNNNQTQKPPLQLHNIKPEYLGNDYLASNFLVAPPPLYQMKFPQIQNPYASFGLNANSTFPQSTSVIPDFPISLPWGLPTSSNLLSLGGFNLNNNNEKAIGPYQSFVSGQQLHENDTRLVRPKQEERDDNLYDGNGSSSSSSSSVYHQLMGNFTS